MPLVTRIRHLASFSVVESNNRLFIDGQAHTPNNLAPIAFDKLGAVSSYSSQETNFGADPLFCLPRTSYVRTPKTTRTENILFDTTINMCGKNIGDVGVKYDSVEQRYYVGHKTNQATQSMDWSTSVFDKDFNLLFTGDLLTEGSSGSGNGGIFLKSKSPNCQLAITQGHFASSNTSSSFNSSILSKFDSSLSYKPVRLLASTGWLQVVYLDTDNVNRWAIVVSSGIFNTGGTTFNANPIYAVDRDDTSTSTATSYKTLGVIWPALPSSQPATGEKVWVSKDPYGFLSSNAEYVSDNGNGNDDVCFYSAIYNHEKTEPKLKIRRTLVKSMSSVAPEIENVDCSIVDSSFVGEEATASRRFRLFYFKDSTSGIRYLGIVGYENSWNGTMSQATHNLYVYRLSSDGLTATEIQKIRLGNLGAVRNAIPMDSSLKKWLVVYPDKFSIYQWNPATNFALQSTQNIPANYFGVDSLGRLWVAEAEQLSAIYLDGQKLYYFPSSGTAIALQASFQSSSYTFSGTPINSNIVINAFDLSGQRTAVDVIVNLEGSNVTFADGSTQKTLTTATGADTLVPIIVRSTGLLRATIMEAV